MAVKICSSDMRKWASSSLGWEPVRRKTTATPNPLPASFLRGGTSKGIYINADLLPSSQDEWTPILCGLMGSPDSYGRQLNGMGGGVSSLSKVCVVGPPRAPEAVAQGADVEYTFVQVGIDTPKLDFSGNCGNLTSMVGVFAVDEGICRSVRLSTTAGDTLGSKSADATRTGTVRLFNTNTRKLIDTTFPVSVSSTAPPVPLLDLPQTRIAGVDALSSAIALDFLNPAGTRTGALLPTGNPTDTLTVPSLPHPIRASLIDATNPTIFVPLSDLSSQLPNTPTTTLDLSAPPVRNIVELIRQAGARAMRLDPTAQAQPKIAFLSPPPDPSSADLRIDAFSMGVPHKAVPGTVALCAGVAASVEGTVPWEIVSAAQTSISSRADWKEEEGTETRVRLRHPSGDTEVGAVISPEREVQSARLFRTGRRLMKGAVWW
ncbi:DUF453-domain-containing protein [Coniophora puteana RWD-64-598 SS2]|uniref:DUF453-domain-containing protein n=1 Tax=Coniophora puteana (strain RWD-64-598) TaxID=741705 RepID=A0A5M3MZ55_CONPW|nr:DUF453-domain-containing protein [Coniophora puteana RWD-64-598 SS2]EIW84428.1 DUF453-domain-containing protein [Coniophora puteana RWD-64-598 SS2]